MDAKQQQQYTEWFRIFGNPELGELGPLHFVEVGLGFTLDEWQRDVLIAFGRGDSRLAVKACHGPGKTFIAACIIWYTLSLRFPNAIVVTAPTKGQLEDGVWRELMKVREHMPDFLVDAFSEKTLRIEHRLKPKLSFCALRTARPEKPEALQGVHCEDGWTLLICDEASGVDEAIYRSGRGSMSGHNTQTVLIGNPNRPSGYFHKCFHAARQLWTRFTVSYLDSSRVTEQFAKDTAIEFGEDSNEYRIRVLGEFPTEEGSTVIPYAWAQTARQRRMDIRLLDTLPVVWGVDVAGGGQWATGKNVIIRRNKLAVLPEMTEWGGERGMTISGRIKTEYDSTPEHLKPRIILLDSIGVGAEVFNRLSELGLPVRGINVSEASAIDPKRFANLKAELWWTCREWLENNSRSLPDCDNLCRGGMECRHEQLVRELTSVQYTSAPKVKIEDKRSLYKRTEISPDFADALVLTFSEDAAILGGDSGGGWGKSIVPEFGGLS